MLSFLRHFHHPESLHATCPTCAEEIELKMFLPTDDMHILLVFVCEACQQRGDPRSVHFKQEIDATVWVQLVAILPVVSGGG